MGMKIGVIARADHRGLGTQTFDLWRNLPADKVLVVVAGVDKTNHDHPLSPYAQHPEYFDTGWVRTVTWNAPEDFPDAVIHDFLDGLDIVYCAETPYDYRIYDIARVRGVTTVLHTNPEFYRYHSEPSLPRPDVLWLPSTWLAERIPSARVVPFPVDRRIFPYRHRAPSSVPTFLHVVGHRTQRDRNGTILFYRALRLVKSPVKVIIRSQSRVPSLQRLGSNVDARIVVSDLADRADLYADADVMVLPRRWGGLCLPMNESLASGVGILMTDCSPQDSFLTASMLLESRRATRLRFQGGIIDTYEPHPRTIASRIDRLASEPAMIAKMSEQANALADQISWDTMRPVYLSAFAQAIVETQAQRAARSHAAR